jgi:hypothetical protein
MRGKISVLLFLLLWAVPAMVQAQFNYLINEGLVTITSYIGAGGAVVIPTSIDGMTVTSIANSAFSNAFSLTSVTIPSTVTSIGDAAFANCDSLTSVTIAPGVTNLGDYAFVSCFSLATVTVGNGILNIGAFAFSGTIISSFTIPSTVTNIGQYAFSDTSLTSITIPGNVISIGQGAFNPSPYLTNLTIGNGVASIGEVAFASCNFLGSFTIPPSVNNIAQYAFYQDNMPSVYFEGNAPPDVGSAFYSDPNTTIYYLPGATGWGATFSGLPSVLWNPLIQTNDGNFGVRTNQFGFDITGTSNIPILIEATEDPADPTWTPLQKLTLTNGLFYFSEPEQMHRFYRISSY